MAGYFFRVLSSGLSRMMMTASITMPMKIASNIDASLQEILALSAVWVSSED